MSKRYKRTSFFGDEIEYIEMEINPVYKIPEGYEANVSENTVMLFKKDWKPKPGEVYYTVEPTRFSPVKHTCYNAKEVEGKTCFKTMNSCRQVCKRRNRPFKDLKSFQ